METKQGPQLVNTWKPVTAEWKHIEAPPAEVGGTPEVEELIATAGLVKHSSRSARTPRLIVLYAVYCFVRAAVILGCLWIVTDQPNSNATKAIYSVSLPSIERLYSPMPVLHRSGEAPTEFERGLEEDAHIKAIRILPAVFLSLSIPYVISGVRWLMRRPNARLFTMLASGYSAASSLRNWILASYIRVDLPDELGRHALPINIILPGILLNVFVCLYLAFSPSVLEAFRVGEPED